MTVLKLEALLPLLAARAANAVLPSAKAMDLLVDPMDCRFRGGPAKRAASAGNIRNAVAWAARLPVPWASCLPQAMAAHWMLARRGLASRIRFGVQRGPHGLRAHAWLVDPSGNPLGAENAAGCRLPAQYPPGRQAESCR